MLAAMLQSSYDEHTPSAGLLDTDFNISISVTSDDEISPYKRRDAGSSRTS